MKAKYLHELKEKRKLLALQADATAANFTESEKQGSVRENIYKVKVGEMDLDLTLKKSRPKSSYR
jgi:hypothetical protein